MSDRSEETLRESGDMADRFAAGLPASAERPGRRPERRAFADAVDGRNHLAALLRGIRHALPGAGELWPRGAALPVIDRLTGILAALAAMIMVDHYYGPSGLGLFTWFLSLVTIAAYVGQWGLPLAVENAIARQPGEDDDLPARALAALVILGLAAIVVCCAAAALLPGPGAAAADVFFYLILGLVVLLRNINALRLAMLNGSGQHAAAARLKIRQRIAFLGFLLGFCLLGLPVPLLAIAFVCAQAAMLVMGRRVIRLPAVAAAVAARRRFRETALEGRAYLFTDNLLEVVFYLDILVLGWFVSPFTLGLYARALILVRLFLIVPAAWQPVFRRLANHLAARQMHVRLRQLTGRSMRSFFVGHGLAAIFILVHFDRVLDFFFHHLQGAAAVFDLFALMLPGMVFHAAVTALTPVHEALGETAGLKRIVLLVAMANLVLNLNLVPFAGSGGAALATAMAMFIHFWLFCRRLPRGLHGSPIPWAGSAAALYLTYILLAGPGAGPGVALILMPMIFVSLLWSVGFFQSIDRQGGPDPASPDRPSSEPLPP